MGLLSVALTATLSSGAWAVGDRGVSELHRAVDSACRCADGHRSGMAAALSCTQGPLEFGRLSVKYRDQWDAAARERVAQLEQVIASCLSNALSASEARDRLGMAPQRADGSVPDVYWQRVDLAQLPGAATTNLVRIRHGENQLSTGMVDALDAQQMLLSLARRDGGGTLRIVRASITDAWLLIVRDRP